MRTSNQLTGSRRSRLATLEAMPNESDTPDDSSTKVRSNVAPAFTRANKPKPSARTVKRSASKAGSAWSTASCSR